MSGEGISCYVISLAAPYEEPIAYPLCHQDVSSWQPGNHQGLGLNLVLGLS